MKYQIIKVIKEVNDFEEACILVWSREKQIGVFAVPEPGDEEITAAVTEFVSLFDGRLVLDEDEADDEDGESSANTGYPSAAESFAANLDETPADYFFPRMDEAGRG